MPKLEHTSVPLWAAGREPAAPDRTGTSYVLVGVGADACTVVEEWADELALYHVDALAGGDAETLAPLLTATLAAGRVGLRVRIAGPTGACLALRGVAVTAGVEDDELHIRPTADGAIDLWCVHCGATTGVAAAIDDVVPCGGCGRLLVVYYHVSRRTGRFLGFQVDAEEAAS